jgi:hypothetical protein
VKWTRYRERQIKCLEKNNKKEERKHTCSGEKGESFTRTFSLYCRIEHTFDYLIYYTSEYKVLRLVNLRRKERMKTKREKRKEKGENKKRRGRRRKSQTSPNPTKKTQVKGIQSKLRVVHSLGLM